MVLTVDLEVELVHLVQLVPQVLVLLAKVPVGVAPAILLQYMAVVAVVAQLPLALLERAH
jgi:hypothetical protein